MLTFSQKQLMIELLLKENKKWFSKHKKSGLIGKTIADLTQSMRNETVNSNSFNRNHDSSLDWKSRSNKAEEAYQLKVEEQGYNQLLKSVHEKQMSLKKSKPAPIKNSHKERNGCAYCSKVKIRYTAYIGKDHVVIKLCDNCKVQAERQMLKRL